MLTSCPECRGSISSMAILCPHCGVQPCARCPQCNSKDHVRASSSGPIFSNVYSWYCFGCKRNFEGKLGEAVR